jgi:hypothetical protein
MYHIFCQGTHFSVDPTQNGMALLQSNNDSIISGNIETVIDPFVAELQKIHEMEDKPFNDIVDHTNDIE